MLSVNDYSSISTMTILYYLLPQFLTLWWRVFITCKQAGKQALSRFTGAPSLITNMWKYVFRSKISGLPSRPCQSTVLLSANMQTNTCTKGHMLPSKYCIHLGENRNTCTYRMWYKGVITVCMACVCSYMHTYIYSSFYMWSWPANTALLWNT